MLIFTLGTQASASTWVFNVVRNLLAIHDPASISGYADNGSEVVHRLHPGAPHAVFKAHSLDLTMLGLAVAAPAKVIVTSRDPQDVLVSQQERFGHGLQVDVRNLTKSLSTIASLPPKLETLYLRYEDGFAKDPSTVSQIAAFLEIQASAEACDQIVGNMTPEAVTSKIADWVDRNPEKSSDDWDRVTEWHPGHVGDGVVGKWTERLPEASVQAATGALLPFDVGENWRTARISWSPDLFTNNGEPGCTEFNLDGSVGLLVWGPYLALPIGRWKITPLVTTKDDTPLTVTVDVFTVGSGQGLIEFKTVTVPLASPDRMACEVDVVDHTHPIEMRISSVNGGGQGVLKFGGAVLQYMGESFAAR